MFEQTRVCSKNHGSNHQNDIEEDGRNEKSH